MKRKDWERTEELFHAVVGLGAEERAVYLAQACVEDASLRAEVESLIAAFGNQPELMEQPAFSLGMRVLSGELNEETLAGKQIGPYKILLLLGKGGMGEVYLAGDARLDRKVALKFLSNKFTNDAWAKRQLMKEAQAVAKLDHPNICAVYGFEEHDGYNFMVMKYIEGETLASLIRKKNLEPKQIPRLAIQIVSALAEAHSHGIVHRDIKPQNIMVTANEQVKVLDFGLAKLVRQKQSVFGAGDSESQSSQLGLVLGTVAYMSPEQLRADRLDFRSDIFSFGIVLYEMISGRNPYSCGSNAEIISAILTGDPQPLTILGADVPAGLARIAQKCLKRGREERYQSASELLLDLDNPQNDIAARLHWRTYFKQRIYVALALLLLIIGAASVYIHATRVQTLAVLPIFNEVADADIKTLSGALAEGLTNRLSHLSRLRVKAPTVMPEYKGQEAAKKKAGRDFSADAVLFETLTQQNESKILQVTLVDGGDGSLIWQQEYPLTSDMLTMQKEVADKIIFNLNLSLSEDEKARLSAHQTENVEAYKNYLRGRYYWSMRDQENIKKAINCFEQAINQDPAYAKAYAGLADCYVLLSTVAYGPPLSTKEAMTKARSAAKKALEIDDTLCEAHTSLGVYILRYEWNWQEAEKEFERAIQLNPDYAPARYYYSNLLTLTGHFSESIEESETAKDLEPFSPLSDMNLGRAFYYSRQYDKAEDYCLKILEKNPNHLSALNVLGFVYQQKGMLKESIDLFQRLYSANKFYGAAPLGYAYARAGRRNEALEILNEMNELSKHSYIPPQEKAVIYIGLDDKDQAFMFLQEACNEHFATFPFLMIDPFIASIRSDPRFADLARCTNLAR